jgi:hypothetical protein
MHSLLCTFITRLSCLFFILLNSQLAFGQGYNPFPGSHTYTFVFETVGDTLLQGTRVDTSYGLGQDTVHVFNPTYRLNNSTDFFGGCQGGVTVPNYDYTSDNRYANQPGVFGESMLQRPNGRYDFIVGANQDTFRLETQVPVGSNWLLNASRGITATLDSVGGGNLFGSQ